MARETRTGCNASLTTNAVTFNDVNEHDAAMLADNLPTWKRLLDDLGFDDVELDVWSAGPNENHVLSWSHAPETIRDSKVIAAACWATNTWGGPG